MIEKIQENVTVHFGLKSGEVLSVKCDTLHLKTSNGKITYLDFIPCEKNILSLLFVCVEIIVYIVIYPFN